MAWQRISPEVIVKGFRKCISSAMDGDARSEGEEDEALTVKMETVPLTGKGR
jgi:hypothetical protein